MKEHLTLAPSLWIPCVVLALAGLFCSAAAGPNADGTLVVHAPQIVLSGGQPPPSSCTDGMTSAACSEAIVRIDGAYGAELETLVQVYAAFPVGSSPRLLGVTWGVLYDPNLLALAHYGACGYFELNDTGWPAPHTGSTVIWPTIQTGLLTPVYWFGAYLDHGAARPAALELTAHPSQGGYFGDDRIPAFLDPIAGYSRMGFDQPGVLVCPASGACCHPDGACATTSPAQCARPNIWQGPGTSCSLNPCPQPPTGTCCHLDGSCTVTTPAQCASPGLWMGGGNGCTPNPCPSEPAGACCRPNDSCTVTIQADCPSPNHWRGPGIDCPPDCSAHGIPVGACCRADGSCQVTADCPFPSLSLGAETSCTPNRCPQPPVGACCAPDGGCALAAPSQCTAPNVWLGTGTACSPNPCPAPVPVERSTWGRIKARFR